MAENPVPISEARAQLGDLVSRVRLLRQVIPITQHGKVHAALVPAELAEAVDQAGGPDAAMRLLAQAAD